MLYFHHQTEVKPAGLKSSNAACPLQSACIDYGLLTEAGRVLVTFSLAYHDDNCVHGEDKWQQYSASGLAWRLTADVHDSQIPLKQYLTGMKNCMSRQVVPSELKVTTFHQNFAVTCISSAQS